MNHADRHVSKSQRTSVSSSTSNDRSHKVRHRSHDPQTVATPQRVTHTRASVACERCRQRKIKCGGPMGEDMVCLQCYRAAESGCTFTRVKSSKTFSIGSLCTGPMGPSQMQLREHSGSNDAAAAKTVDTRHFDTQVPSASMVAPTTFSDAAVGGQQRVSPGYATTYASSLSSWPQTPPGQEAHDAASPTGLPYSDRLDDDQPGYHGLDLPVTYPAPLTTHPIEARGDRGYKYNPFMADRALPPPTQGLVPNVFDFEYGGMITQPPFYAGPFDLPMVDYGQTDLNMNWMDRDEWRHR